MLHRATHPDRAGRWRRPAAGLVATLFVAVPALGLTACAPQVVFTVGSTADAVDAGPGDGRCATTADECNPISFSASAGVTHFTPLVSGPTSKGSSPVDRMRK